MSPHRGLFQMNLLKQISDNHSISHFEKEIQHSHPVSHSTGRTLSHSISNLILGHPIWLKEWHSLC